MAMNLAEKILARNSNKEQVAPGDIVTAKIDCAMMDDILGPRVQIADELDRLNMEVWDKDRVVVISDHYTPASNVNQANIVKYTRDWSNSNGVENYYEGQGPCHQVLAENGYSLPGTILVGTDSHTCTAGAFGCFGTGIGSTEMLGVLATGEMWFRVPESIKIVWNGELPKGIMAKDMVLKTIGDIGHAGATYKVMEFKGSTVSQLSMDGRLCIANMAVEAGAKTGLIEHDEKTSEYLKAIEGIEYSPLYSDEEASYSREMYYSAEELVPQVACPHNVDNVKDINEVEGTIIDQAYLGSCTGGRIEDLEIAARIVKGKKVAKGCRLLVSPASHSVWKEASEKGILEILVDAGASLLAPGCGACLGLHSGVLADGEKCISSTNRNFIGRMGSKKSEVYLASPASVASSAIEGCIADPRRYLDKEVVDNG
jgi:3-isopropylmalate/(R)-2-methylmalate dehydratase large subunit